MNKREHWASRLGVVLAMISSAVGLGSFLRFPVQLAKCGGGSFMIPYFTALLLLGLPLMWIEWAMGRYGGMYNHGTMPGIFDVLWKNNRFAKYLGAAGVVLPLTIMVYYIYIGSWTLGYAFFSIKGLIAQSAFQSTSLDELHNFLLTFQGVNNKWGVSLASYSSFIAINIIVYLVLSGGIAKGIERLARFGMPALFLLGVFLIIRVFFIDTPDINKPENSISNGLGYIWNPDFSTLFNPRIWLLVAGQVFFSLSLGSGSILCYASYLRHKDDVAVNAMSVVTSTALVQVIIGGTIAIPSAVAFFGRSGTEMIATSGAYNLGFVALPAVFDQITGGNLISLAWFLLLLLSCITATVSLAQPAITFLMDELSWSRSKAVLSVILFAIIAGHLSMFGLKYGVIDELDFWAGTVGISLTAFVEIIIFLWIFGANNAWKEINHGAQIKIYDIFYYILKFVTPVILLLIFITWVWQEGLDVITMRNLDTVHKVWRWAGRIMLISLFTLVFFAINYSWKRKKKERLEREKKEKEKFLQQKDLPEIIV